MTARLGGRILSVITLTAQCACTSPPVTWDADRTEKPRDAQYALSADGRLIAESPERLAAHLSAPTSACVGSLRLAHLGTTLVAVWWSPRADSSALLTSARSVDNGATWSAVATVDSTDHGATGCAREQPAIAADSASGYVHVTYAILASEGPGLFYAHSMDGGATFHAPVPILYGARLGRTSVAAEGDFVAVVFEDPNSRLSRIGLALSRTMGHIFEERVLPVSDDNGAATQPLVAVQGRRITIAWQEHATTPGNVLRVRSGIIH